MKRTPLAQLCSLILLSLLVATTLHALPPGKRSRWVVLGEKSVSDRVERDTIAVTARRGDFKAIRLEVFDRPVEFRDLEIHFANGTKQDVSLRRVIPKGGKSRVIDIIGRDRVIEKIVLVYDAQSLLGKQAKVRVLGRR